MHPIELSTRVIDSGIVDQPLNRVNNEITELADNLAIVESFSHSVVWDTGATPPRPRMWPARREGMRMAVDDAMPVRPPTV